MTATEENDMFIEKAEKTAEVCDRPPANPYIAGILLGAVLLAGLLILGTGVGASDGSARLAAWCGASIAPAHVASSAFFVSFGDRPLMHYSVFMAAGMLAGALLSAVIHRRVKVQLECGSTAGGILRFYLALFGGIISGLGAGVSSGCTSSQGLTGMALLATGSLVFLGAMFAGGYLFALLVRGQWID